MKLTSEDLQRQLAKGLSPLYVIHGEAKLLAIEAADAIRSAARTAGYAEREVLTVEQGFKWADLRNSTQNMSLFSDRKLIDIRIPTGKPGVEGAQALQDFCTDLGNDIVALITLPRLDKTAQNSKWFMALAGTGVEVVVDDIPRHALPGWIAGRLKRQEQTADVETLEFLSDRVEGNLLAAWQEIQKLALLFPPGHLTFEQVKDAVMDVARYDVFKLTEAMLAGDVARYARILEGLRAEGTATVLILWALSEEVRNIGKVLSALRQGNNLAGALRDARVWGARQKLMEKAVRRFTPAFADRAMRQAAYIDKVAKGLRDADVWDELLQLGVKCAKAGAA